MRRFAATASTLAVLATVAPAFAQRLPAKWVSAAMCIHRHEADWAYAGSSADHGGMGIDVRAWAALAPPGFPRDPAAATPHQQLVVAYLIWLGNGHRFGGQAWPASAAACGLA